jgi:DNA gyrase inhibitor GyrI
MNKGWWIATSALSVGLMLTACTATRSGYATVPHTVLQRQGSFELREYPPFQIAETRMDGPSDNDGFSRLYSFITGRNATGETIAMTTPVFMERSDGTAPAAMAFALPSELETAPASVSTNVWIRQVPGGQFAIHRFKAPRPDPQREAAAQATLLSWLVEKKLQPSGQPIFAYFDPPWIPRWFRRNEVMLRVAEPESHSPL